MECDGVKHKCDLCKKRERGVMLYELELDDEEAELLHRALGELLEELTKQAEFGRAANGSLRDAQIATKEAHALETIIAQLNEAEERKTRL